MKQFDLNIEKILENWETYHAIREIIANALDEQLITQSKDVEIVHVGDTVSIRDYGRGISYTNLTQNENQEKLSNPNVIGKFGIGLKDALATFDRNKLGVTIKSKNGDITLTKTAKQGFSDIVTLHAVIDTPSTPDMIGTDVVISGVTAMDIAKAKALFLKFSREEVLEMTRAGQVVRKVGEQGNIYINGVKVAEEENFLFSYNITEKTKAIQKALNRERSNVGRTAYTDSVKKILLSCKSPNVAEELADDLQNYNNGEHHDELSWIDVQEHSVRILNQSQKVLFVSSSDLMLHRDMIDQAKQSGRTIISIPENLKSKISGGTDFSGNAIVDISQFIQTYNDSFTFDFVNPQSLRDSERKVYERTSDIVKLFGGLPQLVKDIKISEVMRKDMYSPNETLGCWDASTCSIVILRKQLKSLADYSGTLVHEMIHAKTSYVDVSREFEAALTNAIGKFCELSLEEKHPNTKSWKSFFASK